MDVEYMEFGTKAEMYDKMCSLTEQMHDECSDLTALLANESAMLYLLLDSVNWAGFYLMKDGRLVLGPFQGKPAVAVIEVGRGVCGTAVKEATVQIVSDTHACTNHITCDAASRSEIVVPMFRGAEVIGVIDIDAPVVSRFDVEDAEGLRRLAALTAGYIG